MADITILYDYYQDGNVGPKYFRLFFKLLIEEPEFNRLNKFKADYYSLKIAPVLEDVTCFAYRYRYPVLTL
jgi:hypothetical protein